MDRTKEYHALMAQPELDESLLGFENRLRGHTIVFVPGFLSDGMRVVYFLDQRRYFRSLSPLDVDVKFADIDGEDAPEKNARIIHETIQHIPGARPIVLFTHSKGSLDTLHMLVTHRELWNRIAAWVSVQGALLGSPVADFIVDDPYLKGMAGVILKAVFRGSGKALECLHTGLSREFIDEHQDTVSALCGAIKVLCYGSAISGWTPLGLFRDRMLAHDMPNDGLMPIEHTFLHGADVVRNLAGPDHAAVVMAGGAPAFFDRARFSRALISLALRREKVDGHSD